MTITVTPSLNAMRILLAQLDDRIEAALGARDFSFSALTATPSGMEIRFANSAPDWQIALCLPPSGPTELHLRHGAEGSGPVRLMLRVDGAVIPDLALALAAAMAVIDIVRQE